ncbi:hypothetical protein SynRS9902_01521 [Synechococcus sp. RS9902]|nr:hypothetical protein SynRS9902_01521 [Synechococcus sp. RS9902]
MEIFQTIIKSISSNLCANILKVVSWLDSLGGIFLPSLLILL